MTVQDSRLQAMLGPAAGAVCRTFDAMPQALGVLWPVRDAGGAVTDFEVGYTNPSGDAMMGFAMQDEVGVRVLQSLPTLQEMGVFDRLVRVAATGVPESAEIEMTGLWRESVPMSGIYAHSVLPFGEGVLSVAHDLTEERRREAELRDFAAVAAPALRDPLLALQVMARAPGARARGAGRDAAVIEEMVAAIRRAQRLVAGVLEYAGAGNGLEPRSPVACRAVVSEVE